MTSTVTHSIEETTCAIDDIFNDQFSHVLTIDEDIKDYLQGVRSSTCIEVKCARLQPSHFRRPRPSNLNGRPICYRLNQLSNKLPLGRQERLIQRVSSLPESFEEDIQLNRLVFGYLLN